MLLDGYINPLSLDDIIVRQIRSERVFLSILSRKQNYTTTEERNCLMMISFRTAARFMWEPKLACWIFSRNT